MKILVTGGLGFIGSALVRHLIKEGHEVHNIDCITYAANFDNLADISTHPNYKAYYFNLIHNNTVHSTLKNFGPFDIVLHLAAHSHVDDSINNPEIFMENVNGTFNLLDAWKQITLGEQGHKSFFLYMSTDEVMGDLPIESKERFTTKSPLNPSSPYSSSKAAAELIARSYRRTYDLPITCLRSSNAYGPRQHVEKLIPKTISLVSSGNKMTVHGSGLYVRDWIYVNDLAEAIAWIGTTFYDRPVDEVPKLINVGSSNEVSNLAMIREIISLMGKDPDEWIEFVEDRPGQDLRYAIDTTELEELGWKSTTSLSDGLGCTLQWYSDQEVFNDLYSSKWKR